MSHGHQPGAGCEGMDPLLGAFASDQLDEAARDRLGRHLAACDRCRARLIEIDPSFLFHELRGGIRPEAFWASLQAGLRARLGEEPRRGWSELLRYPKLAYVTAPLAMALVLAVSLMVMRPGWGPGAGKGGPPGGIRSPYEAPETVLRPAAHPAPPDTAGRRAPADVTLPSPPVLEEVTAPGARVYRFTVGGAGEETPIYLVVDESIDI
jgi:Putative zinc-finger